MERLGYRNFRVSMRTIERKYIISVDKLSELDHSFFESNGLGEEEEMGFSSLG